MHSTSCGTPKGTCQTQVKSNCTKIKPVALAVLELCLSEGISQSVENSVKQKKLNFYRNSSKAFRVVLKACLGLIVHNQYYQGVVKVLWVWFLSINFGGKTKTFVILLYSTTVLYDAVCFIKHNKSFIK